MNRFIIIAELFIASLFFAGLTAHAAPQSVPWDDDLVVAYQAASASGKPILLHFFSNNCPPCKMLDTRAFKDERVVQMLSEQVIPLKINVDKRRDLAERFEVTRWPTDVYLHPNGDEIGRSVSPQDPDKYCQLVSRVEQLNHDWVMARIAKKETPATAPATGMASRASQSSLPKNPVANEHRTQTTSASLVNKPSVTKSAVFALPAGTNLGATESNPYCSTKVATNGLSETDSVRGVETIAAESTCGASNGIVVARPDESIGVDSEAGLKVQMVAFGKDAAPNRYAQATARLGGVMSEDTAPAMDGCCPVMLRTQKAWVLGNESYAVKHRGRVYYLASDEARSAFLQQPDFYSPILSGYDIVHFCETGNLVSGSREFGCESGGHIFLFKDPQTYDIFCAHRYHYLEQISPPSTSEKVAQTLETDPIRR